MTDGPDIQHKAKTKGDLAFESGKPVPTAEPEIYFDEDPPEQPEAAEARGGMTLIQFIDSAMRGAATLEEVGARVVLASFIQKDCLYRPKSLRELAVWMDCSHPTASKKLTTFLAENIGDNSDSLTT
jgi:hypothetical protein